MEDELTVRDVFNAMKRAHLATTKDAFSSDWLGMHWSYYRTMDERTTVGPLMTLWKRLSACGESDLARLVFQLVDQRADRGTGIPRPDRLKVREPSDRYSRWRDSRLPQRDFGGGGGDHEDEDDDAPDDAPDDIDDGRRRKMQPMINKLRKARHP